MTERVRACLFIYNKLVGSFHLANYGNYIAYMNMGDDNENIANTALNFAEVITSELIFVQNLYLPFAMMALQANIHI